MAILLGTALICIGLSICISVMRRKPAHRIEPQRTAQIYEFPIRKTQLGRQSVHDATVSIAFAPTKMIG
ncbi:MAG: hypothetical protein B7Z78_03605 [Rhodospirillales bacterium 20-60-12]|nr:MAG: hypothetical protein B7Z78_03605 [Rhodospirillales bacterium 20-60-12]